MRFRNTGIIGSFFSLCINIVDFCLFSFILTLNEALACLEELEARDDSCAEI